MANHSTGWRSTRRKAMWYQEVLFPAALGLIMVSALTFVVYSGNQRDQLAGKVERMLLNSTLNFSRSDAVNADRVQVISETDSDSSLASLKAPGRLKGVPINIYATVLSKVLAKKPELVVLSWVPGAHSTDVAYLASIIASIRTKDPKTKLWIPYPIFELANLPEAWRQEFVFLEGDHCGFPIQVMCSFNIKWNKWIVQRLVSDFSTQEIENNEYKFISRNLPHTRPSFLLNLPNLSAQQQHSFADILNGDLDEFDEESVVFIGSAVSQLPGTGGDEALLRRVRLPGDSFARPLENAEPYHLWWARITQMLVDDLTISIPPKRISTLMTVVLLFCIVILIWKAGAGPALGIFLLYSTLYPIANIIFVMHLHTYLPVFDSIYFGLVTFLILAFGRMSYEAHNKGLLLERKRRFSDLADLKTNFIAMTSHNLNTPIAKMQGLTDLITIRQAESAQNYVEIKKWVALMQVGVRSVLMKSAMDAGNFSHRTLNASQFWTESRSTIGGILKRLNVSLNWKPERISEEFDEGSEYIPFRCDVRGLTQVVVNLAALLSGRSSQGQADDGELAIGVFEENGVERVGLIMKRILSKEGQIKVGSLCDPSFEVNEESGKLNFFERVMVALIRSFVEGQAGQIRVTYEDCEGGVLTHITLEYQA